MNPSALKLNSWPTVAHTHTQRSAVGRASAVMVMLMLAATATGCVAVKPHQRGKLSSPVMVADADPEESKLDGHVYEYREGSIGGSGVSGGGCGCN